MNPVWSAECEYDEKHLLNLKEDVNILEEPETILHNLQSQTPSPVLREPVFIID